MCPEDKVIYLDPAKSAARAAGLASVDQLRQLATRRLGGLLGSMLDQADDSLFERAEKAENSQIQAAYFDAMRQLRLRRKELEEGFQRELIAAFRAVISTDSRPKTADAAEDDDLSLLDNETLELAIAVESMAGKARARNGTALSHLLQRLEQLLPKREVSEDTSPLDPQQITRAFSAAAEILTLEISAQLVIFKLFDKFVMGELPGFYEEVNRMLAEGGVLPGLKGAVGGRRSEAPAPARPKPVEPPAVAPAAPTTSVPVVPAPGQEGQLFEMLHTLLAQQKYSGGPAAPGAGAPVAGLGMPAAPVAPAAPAASVTDVVAALSALQQTRGTIQIDESDLKALLHQALGRGADRPKALGRVEDDTIDIVAMLFEAILDDPRLPASIKALIARLQIPVLKVALLDHSFFGSQEHPARRLINEMARAAVGWVEPAQLERDPFYRRMDSIVDRVLTDFEQNLELFENLLKEFLGFLDEERERARTIEERTRQAAEGKAKVDGAKARVEGEIAQRLTGKNAPAVVRTLLDEAWSKVLFITYLKEGEEGETWRQQLNVVDRLMWSIEPKTSAVERKNLLVEIPGLLHDIREGLNAILFNPFEMTKLFKALEAEHIRCLAASGGAPATAVPESAPLPEAAPVAATPESVAAEPEVDEDLAEYLGKLQDVSVGTWFEFTLANGNKVRAKLSARLTGGRRLIFVNRAGFKMADKTVDEMARDLRKGAAVILDDNLLFDKALETVISNLRDLRAGQ